MPVLRFVAVDPSLRNFGIARGYVTWSDQERPAIAIESIELIQTESRKGKVVRSNSDDLRCAMELHKAFVARCAGSVTCFAEIPSGAQSARAAMTLGIAVGVVAACPIPITQVQPLETKLATVGSKTASKAEMIAWATAMYPKLPWLLSRPSKKNPNKLWADDNEHMADAIAIAHAGVQTEQFKQLMALHTATIGRSSAQNLAAV